MSQSLPENCQSSFSPPSPHPQFSNKPLTPQNSKSIKPCFYSNLHLLSIATLPTLLGCTSISCISFDVKYVCPHFIVPLPPNRLPPLLATPWVPPPFLSHTLLILPVFHLPRSVFQVTQDDAVSLIAPNTFDPFVVQMFLALSSGARLVLVPEHLKKIPSALCKILFDRQRVTVFQVCNTLS